MSLAVIALAVEVDGQFAFLTDLPLAHHHDRLLALGARPSENCAVDGTKVEGTRSWR